MPLVATLWSLTLLAAIAISLSFSGNISYRLAQNSFHGAVEDELVDAAVNRTVLALLDPRTDYGRLLNGTAQSFDYGGGSMRIRIEDELGKIDLNQTDGSTLAALFQSAGLAPLAANALADKVLDWRDNSHFKRVDGAKADDYRTAGYDYGPRNGPFQSVDELTLVMDMTPELYRRVEPALTVYSGRQFVDPQFAAPAVLAALPGIADAHAAAVGQTPGATASVSLFGGLGAPIVALKGRAFTINTEISRSAYVVRYHSVIRLTGNPAQPFWTLVWQRS
jgi:general secretion pathway protein K